MRSLRPLRGVGSVVEPIELSDASPSSSPLYPKLNGAASRLGSASSRKRAEKRSLPDAFDEQANARPTKEPARGALKTKSSTANVPAGASKAAASPSGNKGVSSSKTTTAAKGKARSRSSYAPSKFKSIFGGAQRPSFHTYRNCPSYASTQRNVSTKASAYAKRSTATRKKNVAALEESRSKLEEGLAVYVLEKPVGVMLAPWNQRKPSLCTTANREEATELIQCIPKGVPLSVDAEWTFDYKGGVGQIALLQIAAPGIVLLLQLTQMKVLPDGLKELLLDETGWKVGVNISNDARKLFNDWNLSTAGLLELSTLAKMADPVKWSGRTGLIALRDLVRVYLKRKLRKDATRTSNWELAKLTAAQIEYGACDVYAGLEVGWLLLEKLDQNLAAEAAAKTKTAGPSADMTSGKLSDSASASASSSSTLPINTLTSGGPTLSAETRKFIESTLTGYSADGKQVNEAAASVFAKVGAHGAKAAVTATAASASKGGPPKSHERAFAMWLEGHEIERVCSKMRSEANPLKLSTVASYLIKAAEESGLFPPLPRKSNKGEAKSSATATVDAASPNAELRERFALIIKSSDAHYGIRAHRPFLRKAGFLAKGEAMEGWSESSDSDTDD